MSSAKCETFCQGGDELIYWGWNKMAAIFAHNIGNIIFLNEKYSYVD